MRIRYFVYLFIAIVFLTNNLYSQISIDNIKIDYSSPKEYEIGGITVSGVKFLDPIVLQHVSGLKVGEKVMVPGDDFVDAINKLWKQGLFSDVKITATKIVSDKIFIDIYLLERPRLSKFSFSGIKKNEADDLREDIKLIRGTQVTENLLLTTKNITRNYFIDKGFHNIDVNIVQKTDSLFPNKAILDIVIEKGEKIKINDIIFEGNTVFTEDKLWRAMKDTKRKKWWHIFKASKFIEKSFEDDKAKILAKYNEKGYRDAEIIEDTVYALNNELLEIKLKIKEGQKYYFRNIKWVGNTKYTSEFLSAVLGIESGDVFDQSILDDKLFIAPDALSALYLDKGYLFFSVNPIEVLVENDSIDMEMQIYEGKQARINNVTIIGNTKTNDHVVRREIRTRPGDLFNRSDIIRSTRELAQLGFFDPEKLDVKPSPDPSNGTVDLEYVVEEKPSDQIELSGGFGGGMVIGTLGLVFNNFSARNVFNGKAWRPLPSGDGQKLSMRAQTNGTYYQAYSMSFVEPWLGGKKPNSLSVSIYHTLRSLGTRLYDNEQSMKITGATLGFGKRLEWPDDYFTLSHSLSYQRYILKDYDRYFIFTNGTSNNISLRTLVSRHSAGPNPIFPTTGSIFSMSLQFTPAYSLFKEDNFWELTDSEKDDINNSTEIDNPELEIYKLEKANKYNFIEYHKWKFSGQWFSSLFDKFVLNTKFEFGMIGYYNKNIGYSPFETFNVGGDGLSGYDLYGTEVVGLRGYDNGTSSRGSITPLSPRTGNVYDKFTFELRYPFTLSPSATVFGLVFVEGGNAWYEWNDFNPFDIYRSAGVGVRIFLPMFGMLGVDWGYGFDDIPLSPNSNKGQFAFVIGQQF